MYLATYDPPATAIPVATACAAMAPTATETGFCAALNAIVDRNDLSPNSAANTSPNVLMIFPLSLCIMKGEKKKNDGQNVNNVGFFHCTLK